MVGGLLARGWFRGRRAGWVGTGAVLAAALTLLVLVTGIFTGMQAETEDRVADVFTQDLRITPVEPGIFGPGIFEDASEAITQLGTGATPRMESQSVLSRRGFIEAIVSEDDQYTFTNPGSAGDKDSVSLGVMVGVPFGDDKAAAPYRTHLVRGHLPATWDGTERIPVVMSVDRLRGFLSDDEVGALKAWPPTEQDLDLLETTLQFEVTAAVVTDEDGGRDVIRHRARVVGIYETDVETLDSFTLWAPIEATRYLLGHEPGADIANVLAVHGDAGVASARAEAQGWATESPSHFTERYLGQLVLVLQTLSTATAIVLFTVPAFLVAHGLERVLEEHKREVAVLRAVGVPDRMVRGALARLVVGMAGIAIIVAAFLVTVFALLLHQVLPTWEAAPLPLDVRIGVWTVVSALAVAIGSVAVAFLIALRSQRRIDLAGAMRAL